MRHRLIALDPADVQIKIRGGVRPGDVRRARQTVAELSRLAHEPVLGAKVTLATAPGPEERRTAEAVVDVQGRLVRARAGAASTRAAIHLLGDRLRTRLLESARGWENRRGRHHHQRLQAGRGAGEPRIVRVLSAVRAVPDEAVVEMDQLDHDFLLFVDPVTGGDCLVHRTADGYRLVRLDPRPELPPPTCAAISVATEAAPRLSVAAAVERLELGGFPFVFFADADTGAGRVVHRRADGAYGLVTTPH
ncbi:sigma 54 modulation/S30EA ribosomal C-terminal domain-containing protein [Nonomuraea wenchangensis]|uniref:sigma 54 modulation/S30EA ribosomal C-terminal domain-containing protein n=1 Tax=Nonomuraea wenchangensis TaxID=568860 RepID=UPI00371D1AC6